MKGWERVQPATTLHEISPLLALLQPADLRLRLKTNMASYTSHLYPFSAYNFTGNASCYLDGKLGDR
jgi:hypothetical protein